MALCFHTFSVTVLLGTPEGPVLKFGAGTYTTQKGQERQHLLQLDLRRESPGGNGQQSICVTSLIYVPLICSTWYHVVWQHLCSGHL